ncbi:MAG: DUF2284 domain-containing protein [Deltaproteobacteria bacterium]|nr:DUF2284 domain-containing protein [Deltaproteobacteria bacterium]
MAPRAGLQLVQSGSLVKALAPPISKRLAGLLKVLEMSALELGTGELILIDVDQICVADWVQWKCKYGCKNYGRSWCCPPETPTPEQARAILKDYREAILIRNSGKSINHYRENNQKRRQQVHGWKSTVALERRLFLAGYYKAFALVSESCALCRECSYPESCKFPMNRRPPVESFSIDVFQTLENIGMGFRIAKNVVEEHNTYSIILLD